MTKRKYRRLTLFGLWHLQEALTSIFEHLRTDLEFDDPLDVEVFMKATKLLSRVQIGSTMNQDDVALPDRYTVSEETVEEIISLYEEVLPRAINYKYMLDEQTVGFFEV